MSGDELPPGAYRAPMRGGERRWAELRERGSRFVAVVEPVTDEAEARRALAAAARRFPDASHHCWAWRLGRDRSPRSSDAGEPAGTAGVPILRVLEAADLSDALLIVARWFGGTKLGKGGLARAYAAAARLALERARIECRLPSAELAVDAPYAAVGAIKRLLRPPEVELLSEEYGRSVRLVLRVADHRRPELVAALAALRLVVDGR